MNNIDGGDYHVRWFSTLTFSLHRFFFVPRPTLFSFAAVGVYRLGHSSSSKKRYAKKESKLTPKDKAPIKTMDDRVTEILAR